MSSSLPSVPVRDLQLDQNFEILAGFGDTERADAFVFRTSGPTTPQASEDLNIAVGEYQECIISKAMDASRDFLVSEDSASGAAGSDVDGRDFLLWRKTDGTNIGIEDIDLSLSAADAGGIPVTQAEYAVMITLM
jgi:hypothetical protein